nr:unnamed protein product [Spirometra erinaceieuropaei]
MRIHENEIDCSPDTPSTSSTPTMPSPAHTPPLNAHTAISSTTFTAFCTPIIFNPAHTPSPSAPTTTSSTISITGTGTDAADFSSPQCPSIFTSRIGMVGYLRIHRTETGKPVPGAPTCTRRIRIHCPHCVRMGLLGFMLVHKKTAVDSRRMYPTITSSLASISPHINIINRKHLTATSHTSGMCASRPLLHAAHLLHV